MRTAGERRRVWSSESRISSSQPCTSSLTKVEHTASEELVARDGWHDPSGARRRCVLAHSARPEITEVLWIARKVKGGLPIVKRQGPHPGVDAVGPDVEPKSTNIWWIRFDSIDNNTPLHRVNEAREVATSAPTSRNRHPGRTRDRRTRPSLRLPGAGPSHVGSHDLVTPAYPESPGIDDTNSNLSLEEVAPAPRGWDRVCQSRWAEPSSTPGGSRVLSGCPSALPLPPRTRR